jgi:4-hydroxy-tetrahydrodipicolinate reductase
MSSGKVTVMMNGLPGAMGVEVSQACIRRGFDLAPVALTGPSMPKECDVEEGDKKVHVKLVGPDGDQMKATAEMKEKYGDGLVIIDFTHPTAVNPNSEIYTSQKVAFVMGTTGGDRAKLQKVTEDSETYAVIAPNMCKQIVAFQATMDSMAKNFPGAFGGYKMELVESHQSTKADTSGTAKAVVGSFNALGVQTFNVDDIKKIRQAEEQKAMGVPEEHLTGHAWHTYTLTSSDGSVKFEFQHNVNGRRTYAEGVADAVQFLANKIRTGSKKRLFSMIDVLGEGAMSDKC